MNVKMMPIATRTVPTAATVMASGCPLQLYVLDAAHGITRIAETGIQ